MKQNKLNVSLKLDQQLDFITKGLNINALVNWNSWAYTEFYQSMTSYFS